MFEGFVRVAAITPEVRPGDPDFNATQIEETARAAADQGARIIVTPELSITGYTCGDLFLQDSLISGAMDALNRLVSASKDRTEIVIVGIPLKHLGKLYNAAAVYSAGILHGFVPKTFIPNYGEYYEYRHFTAWDYSRGNVDYVLSNAKSQGLDCRASLAMTSNLSLRGAERRGNPAPIGTNLIFQFGEDESMTFAIEICEDLWTPAPPSVRHAQAGAHIIFNLSAGSETIGKADYRRLIVNSESGRLLAAYVYVNAGYGESTTDMVFSGHSIISENGSVIAEKAPFAEENILISEIDIAGLAHDRQYMNTFTEGQVQGLDCRASLAMTSDRHCEEPSDEAIQELLEGMSNYTRIMIPETTKTTDAAGTEGTHPKDGGMSPLSLHELLRYIDPQPFVPSDPSKRNQRCEEILTMQATGLATRLAHSKAKVAVVGLSGGLDSTLALLVTIRAANIANIPQENVIAVTMPSFGTTSRTKSNAVKLAESLGVTLRDIDITPSVKEHLAAIGHDEDDHNVVFENAQARTRTLVLMDIANEEGGLVIGTGDLSELALGWATYNGDHMSMYGVNAGVPKTLVRHIVKYVADATKAGGLDCFASLAMTKAGESDTATLAMTKTGESDTASHAMTKAGESDTATLAMTKTGESDTASLAMTKAGESDTATLAMTNHDSVIARSVATRQSIDPENSALANILEDILDTPVSPELLPPTDGEISQKTEELVGPYELHDFFLYHMIRKGRRPKLILELATQAFEGTYEPDFIKSWLKVFYKRFFANQFKRSSLPDGPKIGSISLSPRGDWRMPSDAGAETWLKELD
jgi:NAD+ synthase (glutamine-hydrolysing)